MAQEHRKPLPRPLHTETSKPFWEGTKRHELMLPRCRKCGSMFFYPREVCPVCLSPDIEWQRVSGRGRLHSYTVIHQPANRAFNQDVPYIYAMVQLDEGPRIISNLVECPIEQARIDMPVEATFDDVTPEWTLVKFKPV